jgi:ADP-ribose pyrophosphatase
MAEVLLEATKFRVERRQYAIAGRSPATREIVVHPGAVVILPLLDDKCIVLIHNYRYTVEQELIELPAGTLEPPEPPLACAGRELEEETGYRAGRIEPLGQFYTTPGITDERMHCFVAYDLTEVGQRLEGGEQIRTEIVALATALDWIRQGRILDGKTIALLLRYAWERNIIG